MDGKIALVIPSHAKVGILDRLANIMRPLSLLSEGLIYDDSRVGVKPSL